MRRGFGQPVARAVIEDGAAQRVCLATRHHQGVDGALDGVQGQRVGQGEPGAGGHGAPARRCDAHAVGAGTRSDALLNALAGDATSIASTPSKASSTTSRIAPGDGGGSVSGIGRMCGRFGLVWHGGGP